MSSESTVEEEALPLTGTSDSSNSTGAPHSESDSLLDSSSDESDDTEADGSALSEDLCAHVIIAPDGDNKVRGWMEFYAPAIGHFADSVRVEANFWDLEDGENATNSLHALQIHSYGDLSRGCRARTLGDEYAAAGFDMQTVRASSRGLANYYDWNSEMHLDGAESILGRSVALFGNGDDSTDIIACGIIQPGCSPCRDGSCFPDEEEEHTYGHVQPYHPFGYHHL